MSGGADPAVGSVVLTGSSNVLEVLRQVAARYPARPALITGDGSITFGDLWDRVSRAAAGLRVLGLAPGDRAVVMIPMSIDLYVAMLAVLHMGAVAVFVDPWIGRRQIAAFAAFAEPRAWIGIPKSHLLRLLSRRLRSIPFSVTTGWRLGPLPAGCSLDELEETEGNGEVHPASPEEPLVKVTSAEESSSTGWT